MIGNEEPNLTPARQPRRFRRLRACVVAVATFLVCLGGGWLLWSEVGPAEYRQVRAGMSLTEVLAILGPPKGRGEKWLGRTHFYQRHEWATPHGVISVIFAQPKGSPFAPMPVFRKKFCPPPFTGILSFPDSDFDGNKNH